MPAPDDILIAGAGIGGLTAALCLVREGFSVQLFERANRLDEVGAGLQLSPNAGRVLASLGLLPGLQQRAIEPEKILISSTALGQVTRIPLRDSTAPPQERYRVIHRADLQAVLVDQVLKTPAVTLHLGTECQGHLQDDHSVALQTSSGEFQGRCLIAADGVRSIIRQGVFAGDQAVFSGSEAWRGIAMAGDLPASMRTPDVRLWLGADAHVVAYPMSGGDRINIVVILSGAPQHASWSSPGDGSQLMQHFGKRWGEDLLALLDKGRNWSRWSLYTRDASKPWVKGRIALLGDAAHAMLPFAAQGAGMAIEDAAVIARTLAGAPDNTQQALRAYQAERQSRVTKVQATARQSGWIYHLGGPMAFARDISMKLLGPNRLQTRQSWIYSWTPDGPA